MPDPVNIPRLGYVTPEQAEALVNAGSPDQLLVVGIMGDSNSDGGGGTVARPEQLPGEQDEPVKGLFSLSAALSLIPARMPLAEGEASINIDAGMSLGKYLLQAHGRGTRILLVQCSAGGTSFVNDDWNPGDPAYENAVTRINAALALPGARPGGLWINLGAIDQLNSGSIAAFPGALTAMVNGLRGGDLEHPGGEGLESMPVVLTTTRFGDDPDKTTINNHIRGLSRTLDYCAIVEGEDLPSSQDEGDAADDVHFGPLARRELGRRVAHGILEARIRHPLSRQFRDSDVTKLDGIDAGAEVNVLETISNVGTGAQVAKAASAKDVPLRSLLNPQGEATQNTNDVTLHPFPAVPEADVRIYSTGSTGTAGEILVAAKSGVTATKGTQVNVVGSNGDARGPVIGFPGTNAMNVDTYTIPEGAYTVSFWINPPVFPVSDAVVRRSIMGSQSTTASNGWHISLEREVREDTSSLIVDQWWHLRASHLQDAGVVGGTRMAPGRWYFATIVMPYDVGESTGALSVFINGNYEHSRGFPPGTDRTIQIGSFNADLSFVGALDDIRFWPIALTPRQIERLYLETISPLFPWGSVL